MSTQTIISRFAEQALRNGEGCAVRTPEGPWTYAELDAWSNGIADTLLRSLGPVPRQVALLFNQGTESVAATLGVLKSGKCYVPLDPSHPHLHSAAMCAYAEATAVITERALAPLASQIASGKGSVIVIEDIAKTDALSDVLPTGENDPAYIFFTSGSTGKPKGVVDSHRNVLHNIGRYTNALDISPEDRLTMIQSPTFSGTVSSMFCALLNGATLLPFDVRANGFNALAEWLVRSRATVYHSVPSIFRGVVEAGERFPDVRVVRLEGDGATRKDLKLFGQAFGPGCLLAHGLGATETGLSCQYKMGAKAVVKGDRLPIGHPLPGMDVRIVDGDGHEVPYGTIGEIEVRSEFLALGYWRDDDATLARFRPVDDHIRSYLSGDLGRVDENGLIVHLGRKDLEHKISGQWVNTAEVEEQLLALGDFKQALVVTQQDGTDDARLVAYVVPIGSEQNPGRWRSKLMEHLPDHMIPRHFVCMEQLPVSEHGKVDRRALPPPSPLLELGVEDFANEQERDMAAVWKQVLEVERVPPTANFFDLGGKSIDALRILALVGKRWGVRLQLADLYTAPSVRAMARSIERKAERPPWKNLAAVHEGGTGIPLVCVHGDDANHHLPKLLPKRHPFFAFFHQAEDGTAMKYTSIGAIAEHYLGELEQALPSGPLVLIGYSHGGNVALSMAQHLATKGRSVPLLVLIDTAGPDKPPASWTLKRSLLNVRDAYNRLRCARYLRQHKPIPVELRTFYIMDSYTRAAQHHITEPWPGRTLLIRSQSGAHSDPGWAQYCDDLQEVTVPGDHLSIVRAGNIGAVAQQIARSLEEL